MTAQTHRQFAVGWAYIGGMFIYSTNISQVNYYLMLMIVLAFGKIGALFPDWDHTWRNVKDKSNIKWIVNKLIHLTGGKHRSWQTHSWDICILATFGFYILNIMCYRNGLYSNINFEVINIVTTGFNLGWMSHLFSDMLTSGGVRIVCFLNYKVSFVPKYVSRKNLIGLSLVLGVTSLIALILGLKIGIVFIVISLLVLYLAIRLGNIRFNTGNEWEAFVYKTTKTLNKVIAFIALVYPWVNIPELRNLLSSIIKLISRQ